MCEAWEGIMEDCRLEGRKEGEMKGRLVGITEALASLVRDGLLDIKTAATRANMTESELQEAINKLS